MPAVRRTRPEPQLGHSGGPGGQPPDPQVSPEWMLTSGALVIRSVYQLTSASTPGRTRKRPRRDGTPVAMGSRAEHAVGS